jgi:hypothetical protein
MSGTHLFCELQQNECGTCMMVLRHTLAVLCEMFSVRHHDWWIGRGGPTVCPPRWPDWNPLDFYLWGNMESIVSAAPVDNEDTLQHRIAHACETICNCTAISERMWRSITRRIEAWTESHAGLLRNYYKRNLSSITHKLKISENRFIWILCCSGTWNSGPEFVNAFQLHPAVKQLIFLQFPTSDLTVNEKTHSEIHFVVLPIGLCTVDTAVKENNGVEFGGIIRKFMPKLIFNFMTIV